MRELKPYTTQRGKQGITDANMFTYTENGGGKDRTRFRCSKRSCKATLIRNNMTGTVIGELPEHNHANQLLKKQAQETEQKVVGQFASVPGTTAAAVLQEISTNMLNSDFPGEEMK